MMRRLLSVFALGMLTAAAASAQCSHPPATPTAPTLWDSLRWGMSLVSRADAICCSKAGVDCQTPVVGTTPCAATYTPIADADCVSSITAAPSWVSNAGFKGIWLFNESSGVVADNAAATGATDDLAITGTVTWAAAGQEPYGAGTALALTQSDAQYGSLETTGSYDFANSATFGCWVYPTVADMMTRYMSTGNSTGSGAGGFYLQRQANVSGNHILCNVANGNTGHSADSCVTGAGSACDAPANAWTHTVCVGDATANTITTFVDGITDGVNWQAKTGTCAGGVNIGLPCSIDGECPASTCTQSDMTASTTALYIGQGGAGSLYLTGRLDECFIYAGVLSADSICRICSCGIDGAGCTCEGATYATKGRNCASCMNTIALACNAAAPS